MRLRQSSEAETSSVTLSSRCCEAQTSSVTHPEGPSKHWLALGAAGTPTAAAHQFDPFQGTIGRARPAGA
jgi:hypothetical protein